MKTLLYIGVIIGLFIGCNTSKQSTTSKVQTKITEQDTVRIANDKLEYEIIIFEPGFNFWLNSTAKPSGYYTLEFLETRNYQYVIAWNQRVLQPNRYTPNLYELQIDYQPHIDYGYEVNYKLYNYFIYFQRKYKQKLTGFIPRI